MAISLLSVITVAAFVITMLSSVYAEQFKNSDQRITKIEVELDKRAELVYSVPQLTKKLDDTYTVAVQTHSDVLLLKCELLKKCGS